MNILIRWYRLWFNKCLICGAKLNIREQYDANTCNKCFVHYVDSMPESAEKSVLQDYIDFMKQF